MWHLPWLVNSVPVRGLQSWYPIATVFGWDSTPMPLSHVLDSLHTGMGHRLVSRQIVWQIVTTREFGLYSYLLHEVYSQMLNWKLIHPFPISCAGSLGHQIPSYILVFLVLLKSSWILTATFLSAEGSFKKKFTLSFSVYIDSVLFCILSCQITLFKICIYN